MAACAEPRPAGQPVETTAPAPLQRPVKAARGAMDFISPTFGKLSFRQMFEHVVGYMSEEPDQTYHVIIGTDSLLSDKTCFVTAVIIHRLGHGVRDFYREMVNRKMDSLRQRIFFETAPRPEAAGLMSAE